MRRDPSFLRRAFRAATALVTVWCLGCSAYEPLFGSLFGSLALTGMVCASEDGMRESGVSAATAAPAEGAPSVSAVSAGADSSTSDFACSCQSCHAAALTVAMIAPDPLPVTSVPVARPVAPLSVEREPLVPPPQSAPSRA